MRHTFRVLPAPLASTAPLGEKAIVLTSPSCPIRSRVGLPVPMSQIRIEPLSKPAATETLSGEKAKEVALPSLVSKVRNSFPVCTLHNRTALSVGNLAAFLTLELKNNSGGAQDGWMSRLALAMIVPSGEKVTAETGL